MKKQVYELDEQGFIIEIHIAEFNDEGEPLQELADNIVPIDPPNGLYRAKWLGEEWIEDMPKEEIDEKNKVKPQPPSELEMKLKENDLQIADLQQRFATMQDDQLFVLEEAQRLTERDATMQDDILFIIENIGG